MTALAPRNGQSRQPAPRRRALVPGTADGLASVDAAAWNRLLPPAGAALSHGYLRAWETSDLPGLRSCPVVLREPTSGRLVAAAPGHFYDLDIVGVRMPAAGAFLRALRRVRPELLWARTYELGSPTPLTNPFLVDARESRGSAIRGLVEAGIDQAAQEDAQFVLAQSFASCRGPAAEQLEQLGFAPVAMGPTAVLELPYRTFDDYLDAMRAPYRRRTRHVLKRSRHLRVEHRTEFDELSDELAHLWRLIYERATELKREVLTPAFFAAASTLDETSVLLIRDGDGSLLAFGMLLADPPWLAFLHCGFNATAGRDQGAYFRLLYEIVRLAIDGGFEQVELGMTTMTPKLDIGGVPVPLYAWIKHRNPLFQRAIRVVAERLASGEELVSRNVFKEPAPSAERLVARRSGLG